MKNFFVVMAAIFIFTGTAFARLNPEGKVMLGANGDYGFTITGTSDSTENYTSEIGKTYGIGLKVGYGIFSNGIVYTGIELQQKELVVKYDDGIESWKERYSQKYLDIPLAFKLLFGPMYADFGAYYGIRIGNMKYKQTGDYNESGTVEKSLTKNDYGLLLGLGGIILIDGNSGIDIGVKTKFGFAWAVDAPDFKLQVSTAVVTLGYLTVL